ncbi:MAG: hypothetical protein M3Z29_14965 [Pseudomonadota bacterium]|nr:hypothetical protein [Pseudomonadota bacterium]
MTSLPADAAVRVLAERRNRWSFAVGCIATTAGVLLHLPMYWMGRDRGFRLADMPMDAGMRWGMALIVGEQQGRSAGSDRRDGGRPGRRDLPRAVAGGPTEPGLGHCLAHRRQQWSHRHAAALCSESYPLQIRGRATGWVAACTKAGGLAAQLLGILALAPTLLVGAWALLLPVVGALCLIGRYGPETRDGDLRDVDAASLASP